MIFAPVQGLHFDRTVVASQDPRMVPETDEHGSTRCKTGCMDMCKSERGRRGLQVETQRRGRAERDGQVQFDVDRNLGEFEVTAISFER